MMNNGGHNSSAAFRCLVRRKRVDAATSTKQTLATQQLARKLSLFDLVAIANCGKIPQLSRTKIEEIEMLDWDWDWDWDGQRYSMDKLIPPF
ncbi:hypothetical protein MTR67_007864 [Solanum verrucosum]|uniref:Uncharacterized protein n=1 Tax=Solanum verrucosum TaxID=315347 RepID=A0AAF0Q6W3_SOLVR|nr:hypothetical protein MTR67_007864 [Solanum verrucosum]